MLVAVGLYSCDDDNGSDVPVDNQLIVEAYVFAGEPVSHVKLSKVHSEGEAIPVPVSDATVKLSQGGIEVNLAQNEEMPGWFHIEDSNVVFSGSEPIELSISALGRTYSSVTHFPESISGLNISDSTINVTAAISSELLAILSWNPLPNAQAYAVFVRNLDWGSDNTISLSASSDSPFYAVHQGYSLQLFPDHFTHLGAYDLYVSAVNEEYMEMYSEISNPDLRGAPSNIEGAWGVFTAFNGQSISVSVE